MVELALLSSWGNGWVVASTPYQPMQSSELRNDGRLEYAEASGLR